MTKIIAIAMAILDKKCIAILIAIILTILYCPLPQINLIFFAAV